MKLKLLTVLLLGTMSFAVPAGAERDEQGEVTRYINAQWLVFSPASALATQERRAEPASRSDVRRLVAAKARELKVPEALAMAVTQVESRFRCDAVGPRTRHGHAYGPLQILAGSARLLGYTGSSGALRSCGAGLHYGMLHLAKCWGLSSGNYRHAAHCHVQGPGRNPAVPVNAYAASYGSLVLAQAPARADGWLARGSVEVVTAFSSYRDIVKS